MRSRAEDGFFFENTVEPGEINTVTGQLYWGAAPLSVEVVDPDQIFTDGFESGDLTSWSSVVP